MSLATSHTLVHTLFQASNAFWFERKVGIWAWGQGNLICRTPPRANKNKKSEGGNPIRKDDTCFNCICTCIGVLLEFCGLINNKKLYSEN